ncbi:hypothetical protein [Aquabacterium sp. OR-4]|uniref:hypothetical protein n=1 Tax=Aquabacterium sp. OR-4 TaxID=2978127 RepID=UPI0021B409AE|nr:hypothetical protein [Aquabacterium sp. OR-4]MDT7836998.1 hypothetical protein [Aquabacterium sp. OR-4]
MPSPTLPSPRRRPQGTTLVSSLLCGLAALWLALTPGEAAAKEAPPIVVPVNAGFNAGELAAKAFSIPELRGLKGMSRAAVTVFAVEFVTADHIATHTSGFGSAGRASSALYYQLLGVGEADFQALTNALHAQFLARLQASGVALVPPEQLQASPLYRKLVAGGRQAPVKSDTSLVMSPPGLGIFGFARGSVGPAKPSAGVFGALAGLGNGLSAVGDITDTIELSNQLNASLIEMRLRVNFVELSDHNKGFFGRMALSARTSGQVLPSIDGVMVGVQAGPWRSTMTMTHTLALDPAAFAEVREKATTAGDVAGAVLVGLIRLASSSKDSHASKEMEAVADPQRYRELVGGGLAQLADVVVARLSAER